MATLPRLGVLPRRMILAGPSSALCPLQARQSSAPLCASLPTPSSRTLRPFHISAPRRNSGQHFDTLRFVQKLQNEGFTEEQAAALMKILNDVMEERCVPPLCAPSPRPSQHRV